METSAEANPRRRMSTLTFSLIVQGIGLPVVIACPGFVILAHYVAVAPWGSFELLLLEPLPGLAMLLSLPAAVAASLLMMKDRFRRLTANVLVLCLLLFPLMWYALDIGRDIRHQAFVNLASRSRSLVQAVHDYENDTGAPPRQLSDVVPKYLAQIPSTGMGAYPDYELIVPTPQRAMYYRGQRWVLRVRTPSAILNWDEFLYFPKKLCEKPSLSR